MDEKTNQLLLKALNTDSEDEAAACLRMIRKRVGKVASLNGLGGKTTESNKDWKSLAEKYYRIAKDRDAKMNEYYAAAVFYKGRVSELTLEKAELKRQLDKKIPFKKEMIFPAIMLLTSVTAWLSILL